MDVHTQQIAVVSARLPYVDRRALSEAWFASLHFASDGKLAPRAARGAPVIAPGGRPAIGATRYAADSHKRGAAASCAGARERRPPTPPVETRFTSRASAPLPVRRRAAPRSTHPVHAHFTLTIDGARVAVLARREGARVHVIAVCSASLVDTVRRALARAAGTLAASGGLVESSVLAAVGTRS